MPVRQQLKTRTLFNVLGPLINPAHPPLALIGVYSPELVLPIAETLRVLGYQRAAVVHSGGMDEVSLHAPTLVAELNNGEVLNYQLEAADFGLTPYHQDALAGGTPEENRDILTRLLQGKGEAAHEGRRGGQRSHADAFTWRGRSEKPTPKKFWTYCAPVQLTIALPHLAARG